jgi:hypothetical protein
MGYVNCYVQIRGNDEDYEFVYETNLVCRSIKDANDYVRMVVWDNDIESFTATVYQYMNTVKSVRKYIIKQMDN